MRLLLRIVGLFAAVLVGVHGYFYIATGTIDPCKAAVSRIIQTERANGRDLVASLGVLFSQDLERLLRSEGERACYEAALTGEAPDVVIRLDKEGLHTGSGK